MFNTFLATILPPRCPVSGDVVATPGLISPRVWGQLDFIARPFCACCGIRFDIPAEVDDVCPACLTEAPAFDHARAVMAYDGMSSEMILGFKHGDQTHLTRTFAPWLARASEEFRDQTDMIVPVPLHRWRLFSRRYNQAALLSGALARLWGVRHDPLCLQRVKATPSQGHLTRTQRLENVAGAFAVADPVQVRGKNILLVDDVYTTGATVNGCARVLKRAGAKCVNVVTLARVMRSVEIY